MESAEPQKHLYLVDGSGYIFRAYYAVRSNPRSDGTPINAVLGFSNMLMKLLQDLHDGEKPTHFAVIFDTARKSFRNDFYKEYKSHRPPAPEDLVPQFPLIRDATRAFSVPSVEMVNYEADDLIATYAKEAQAKGFKVTIISSDKDLMQLVGDNISMFDSMKGRHIYEAEVQEKFGVGPERVIDVQALAGDSADNVPGVPGIGIKTAAELINTYGDLDAVFENVEEIKQPKRRQSLIDNEDLARISKRLVTLKTDVQTVETLDDFILKKLDVNKLLAFADEMEFKALRARVVSRHGNGDAVDDKVSAPEEPVEYECIQDMTALKKWCADIAAKGVVAVDTETTSLDAMAAKLVGISLSVAERKACYIPLRHGLLSGGDGDLFSLDLEKEVPKQLSVDAVLAELKPILEDPSILKIGQNIKYDAQILANEGVNICGIDDTMLISYVLDCGSHGHGMDELSGLHLGRDTIPFKEVAGSGKSQITFDQVPLDKATTYAAEDADITLSLYNVLKPRLVKESMTTVYETLERPLAQVLMDMERRGVKVDLDLLKRLSNDFAERLVVLEADIHKLAGREFNVASPKQLGEVLFDDLALPGGKRGKTGAYKTGVDVLEALVAEGHELPIKVLSWRQLAKLKSTYTDRLQKDINPQTGRVHTSFSMAGTSTGRLASSDPNIQNIPIRSEEGRKIRRAFVAEAGNKLIAADYSQIELRLLAHIADIKQLKKAFHEGLDIHAMTASEV
ncbi:MAG: DNA polymerase I, partial [Sphingomonadales bacterium]|nr:DNA polymerase I [Sphingomonadales bacterium]